LQATRLVELGLVDSITHTPVGQVLKKQTQTASQATMVYSWIKHTFLVADGTDTWPVWASLRCPTSLSLLWWASLSTAWWCVDPCADDFRHGVCTIFIAFEPL